MLIQSSAYRTDILIQGFGELIIDRGGYLVVKSVSNPSFVWGNFLFFKTAPKNGNLVHWERTFRDEFKDQPSKHIAFGWGTGSIVEPKELIENDYTVENNQVLSNVFFETPSRVSTRHSSAGDSERSGLGSGGIESYTNEDCRRELEYFQGGLHS